MLDETPDPRFPSKPRDIKGLKNEIDNIVDGLVIAEPNFYMLPFPVGTGKNCDVANALAKQIPGVLGVDVRGIALDSQDRVVVNGDGSQPVVVRGMPTVVSIREQTRRRFVAFEQRWSRSHYHERLALQEADTEGVAVERHSVRLANAVTGERA